MQMGRWRAGPEVIGGIGGAGGVMTPSPAQPAGTSPYEWGRTPESAKGRESDRVARPTALLWGTSHGLLRSRCLLPPHHDEICRGPGLVRSRTALGVRLQPRRS